VAAPPKAKAKAKIPIRPIARFLRSFRGSTTPSTRRLLRRVPRPSELRPCISTAETAGRARRVGVSRGVYSMRRLHRGVRAWSHHEGLRANARSGRDPDHRPSDLPVSALRGFSVHYGLRDRRTAHRSALLARNSPCPATRLPESPRHDVQRLRRALSGSRRAVLGERSTRRGPGALYRVRPMSLRLPSADQCHRNPPESRASNARRSRSTRRIRA
jgi:hypothetical protein